MADHTRKKPWHRRPGETTASYERFMVYANLNPTERSLNAAYIEYRVQRKIRQMQLRGEEIPEGFRAEYYNEVKRQPAPPQVKGDYDRHSWKSRAALLDDERSAARIRGQLLGASKSWERAAEDAEDLYTDLIELAKPLRDKARAILEKELTRDNYSMTHAVQITNALLKLFEMVQERERIGKAIGDADSGFGSGEGGESDDELLARFMGEVEPGGQEEAAGEVREGISPGA